ncbi:hypothetical protein AB4K20DRAFT_1225527 [Rhizopus microsporus]
MDSKGHACIYIYINVYFVTIKHILIQTCYPNDYNYSSTTWNMYKQKKKGFGFNKQLIAKSPSFHISLFFSIFDHMTLLKLVLRLVLRKQ